MIEQLHRLGEAADTLDLLDRVYVIDQGSDKVTHRPGFDEAAKKLGDLLEVVEQGNIGGSGGFARAMDETVRAGRADYVLLMDDDVRLDPEGILRAATFADLARRPTIVGGHMFSMYDRSLLHAFAEAIEPHKWWWGPSPNTKARHDFGRRNLRNTPWLHRRAEADYNGWWMCLIPTAVIREIGLSMPVFIKWDDAEYGVRARDRGFPTVSLPGVAAWQVPWDDKDDARNWQAYYHLRNRLVSALLHSPAPKGGAVISESLERQLQSLLSMQYSTVALRLLAVEDVLTGPGHMHREIATKLPQLRQVRAPYTDAKAAADLESFPPPRRKAPDELKHSTTPTNKLNLMSVRHRMRGRRTRRRPQERRAWPERSALGERARHREDVVAVMLERARIGDVERVERRVVVLDARGVREVHARRDRLRDAEVRVVRHPLVDLVEERGRHRPFEMLRHRATTSHAISAARLEHAATGRGCRERRR